MFKLARACRFLPIVFHGLCCAVSYHISASRSHYPASANRFFYLLNALRLCPNFPIMVKRVEYSNRLRGKIGWTFFNVALIVLVYLCIHPHPHWQLNRVLQNTCRLFSKVVPFSISKFVMGSRKLKIGNSIYSSARL